jgi:thiaminase/transcriptional activator TenA
MREVALQGTLGEMLAVTIVCEWSSLSWGQIVTTGKGGNDTVVREDFVTYEWIDLHSGGAFENVVEYFRSNLDRLEQTLDNNERDACEKRFLHAVDLEERFFEYAYSR